MEETDLEFGFEAIHTRVAVFTSRLIGVVPGVTDRAVHETRVESRRLRAALISFRQMFPPYPFKSAYGAVRKITRLLGKPRETAVMLKLVQGVSQDRALDRSCLQYIEARLESRLRGREALLEKELKRVDPLRIRAKLDFLLSVREPAQPALFQMRESALAQSFRALKGFTASISEYNAMQRFDAATDDELHLLRIAAKKARYAMEIYSPIWPGGLSEHIVKARKFQDAGGVYNDWRGLRCFLDNEAKRLHSKESVRLAFEIGRLAEYAESRKSELRVLLRAALAEFQESLAALSRKGRLLAEKPGLNQANLPSSRLLVMRKSKSKKNAGPSSGTDVA